MLEIRLQKAKEIGAHHTIKVTKTQSEDEIVELIKKLLGGEPNKCFECCGSEQSLRVALKVIMIFHNLCKSVMFCRFSNRQ